MDTSKKEYHVTDFTVKIVVVDMLVVLRKLNPSPVWLRSLRMLSAAELSILCLRGRNALIFKKASARTRCALEVAAYV